MAQELVLNLDPDHVHSQLIPADPHARSRDVVTADPTLVELSLFPNGTDGGRSSVGIVAKLPGGKVLFLQVTARNFICAADAFRGRMERTGEWK